MTQEEKSIVIKSTGAIGDMVIASAIADSLNKLGYHTGIISDKKTLQLWDEIPNASTFEEDKSSPNVDISNYLAYMPHSNDLPAEYTDEKRKGHLCEWMAYSISQNNGINIYPSRDDVRIVLNREEIEFGRNEVHKKSKKYNNKPVVILAPSSSTKNKKIPKQTLKEVIKGIWKFAVPCLLKGNGVKQCIIDRINQYAVCAETIGDKDLRKASAILYAADACICVDSAPLHMINGSIQGTPPEYILDGVNPDMSKIVIVVGSSHPDVVSYEGNQIIKVTKDECNCDKAPCGAHGYSELAKYEDEFNGRSFNAAGISGDKSGCIFNDYDQIETARCMEAVSAEEVIETVRKIILR